MRNELRIYLCEVLLHLIVYIAPRNQEGTRLVVIIKEYIEDEWHYKS